MLTHLKTYSLILSIAFLMMACGDALGPETPAELNVKKETKWVVNTSSNSKTHVVSVKEFNNKGDLLYEEEYSESNKLISLSEYNYDGNLTIETNYVLDDSDRLKENYKTHYHYEGKLLVKKQKFDNGLVKEEEIYEYDSNGNLSKKKVIKEGQLVTDLRYSNNYIDGTLKSRYIYKSEESSYEYIDSLVYSENQNFLEKIQISPDGGINNVNKYFYNSYGLITSEETYSSNGILLEKFIYEYTYH